MAEKLTKETTVKMTDDMKRFCEVRAKQQGMESSAEYIRHLITVDQANAAHEFNLLAKALGHETNLENPENTENTDQPQSIHGMSYQ